MRQSQQLLIGPPKILDTIFEQSSLRGAVNKFVEQGIYQKQTITTLVTFESLLFHMPILAILGVCYFPPEQGSLKSKSTFYHSSDDTLELSFSET